jgi:HK97 family phage major capsid protein
MLGDSQTMMRVFEDKGAFGELISKYARVVLDKDQQIATQVREETQRVITDFLQKEQPESIVRPTMSLAQETFHREAQELAWQKPLVAKQRRNLYNPRAMGAKIDKEFANTGEYFQTIWHEAQRDAPMQAKLARLRNAFSSTVPSEGGFLIPEILRSDLQSVALEMSVVMPRARIIPMDSLRVPFPAIDVTSNAASVFGGIVAYWTEEGAALTESQASFGRIVLDAKKLTAYTSVPNELLSDSIVSFEPLINQLFPEALAWYKDIAFMKGTGVGEPLGALSPSNPAIATVSKELNQAASTIVWENIVKMYARMLPSSLGRAVWVASIDTFPELATMALSVGTGGSPVWLTNGTDDAPMTILGRPVIFTEKAPGVLGSQGDISFVDFSYYLVGDRQVMSAMSSPHFKFQNDQTAFRIIERVDGRPWIQSSITPQNGSNALSPFVQLAVRA